MKKMTKGALAIGIGSAMLLGGGGTLATWNDFQNANAGTIVAGDLDVQADPGTWTNASGKEIDINSYTVVPGDVLTFTQPVKVVLSGDQMRAQFTITGLPQNSFTKSAYPVVKVAGADKKDIQNAVLTTSGDYTASASFTFNPETSGQVDTKAKLDLSAVGYSLKQLPVTK